MDGGLEICPGLIPTLNVKDESPNPKSETYTPYNLRVTDLWRLRTSCHQVGSLKCRGSTQELRALRWCKICILGEWKSKRKLLFRVKGLGFRVQGVNGVCCVSLSWLTLEQMEYRYIWGSGFLSLRLKVAARSFKIWSLD